MIPLRDIIPSRTTLYVTVVVIAVNILVFLFELSLGDGVDAFIREWGVVPADVSIVTWVTSMFLHGGILHVGGNTLYLGILATTSRIGWATGGSCCFTWGADLPRPWHRSM